MKTFAKLIIAASLAICSVTEANAQVQLGAKAGLSVSWIPGTVIYGYEDVLPHNSGYAGVSATFDLSDYMVAQTELLFAGKGHSDKSVIDGKYSRSLNYLQLPVLIGVKVVDDKMNLMLGPEFGFLLSSKTKIKDSSVKSTDDCKRFNFALAFQINYMFTDNFGVDVKFDWGLTKTFKSVTISGSSLDKGHNLSAQIGICYKFDL